MKYTPYFLLITLPLLPYATIYGAQHQITPESFTQSGQIYAQGNYTQGPDDYTGKIFYKSLDGTIHTTTIPHKKSIKFTKNPARPGEINIKNRCDQLRFLGHHFQYTQQHFHTDRAIRETYKATQKVAQELTKEMVAPLAEENKEATYRTLLITIKNESITEGSRQKTIQKIDTLLKTLAQQQCA